MSVEIEKLLEEFVSKDVELKKRKKRANALKEELKKRMKSENIKRLETEKGVAFFSTGKSLKIKKEILPMLTMRLSDMGIDPREMYYKKTIRYLRVKYITNILDSDDNMEIPEETEEIIDELIRLNAEISLLNNVKKELSSKIMGMFSRIGIQEYVASDVIVKLVEYEKTMINQDFIKEHLPLIDMNENDVFEKKSYEKFIVVDWSAYQKMIEHAEGGEE